MFGLFDSMFEPEYDQYSYYPYRQQYQQRRARPSYEEQYQQWPRRQQAASYGSQEDELEKLYRQYVLQPAQEKKHKKQVQKQVKVQEPPKPQVEKQAPSEDSAEPPKITNRETIDPPEVAFKTYRPDNMVTYVPQILKPLTQQAGNYLKMRSGAALVTVPFSSAQTVPELQADGEGVLSVAFTGVDGKAVKLEYQLPAFYERSEIQARKTEDAYEVAVPLRGDEKDDVMLIQIQ